MCFEASRPLTPGEARSPPPGGPGPEPRRTHLFSISEGSCAVGLGVKTCFTAPGGACGTHLTAVLSVPTVSWGLSSLGAWTPFGAASWGLYMPSQKLPPSSDFLACASQERFWSAFHCCLITDRDGGSLPHRAPLLDASLSVRSPILTVQQNVWTLSRSCTAGLLGFVCFRCVYACVLFS